MPRHYLISALLSLLFLQACQSVKKNTIEFPGPDPGIPSAVISGNKLLLENKSLEACWIIKDSILTMNYALNKYDHSLVDLQNIELYSLCIDEGPILTNADFKLTGPIRIENINKVDTLPRASLKFSGKKLTGNFKSPDHNIQITWSALLRKGSNYIQQELQINALKDDVKIEKINFWNGILDGAHVSGYVLGSPVIFKNFFFALEHPTAQNSNLARTEVGWWSGNEDFKGDTTLKAFNLTSLLTGLGDYSIIIQPEYCTNQAFNILSAALYFKANKISNDDHPFNFEQGNGFYHLKIDTLYSKGSYTLKLKVINGHNAQFQVFLIKKVDGLLNFYIARKDQLKPSNPLIVSSVAGVSPEGQIRRSFLYYLERERARPYKQFLHYNTWYDISGPDNYLNADNTSNVLQAWGEKFINKYHIDFQSFVLDDGWDDLNHLWSINTDRFPQKFTKLAAICKNYNSGLGIWMSPFGGYGTQWEERLKSGKREGFELNGKGFSLAGSKYYHRFMDRALSMMAEYGVNYFKFDGFGGADPEYLPDMEAGVLLITELRRQNPEVFINATTGTWPSPLWLRYVDATWRQGADMAAAGKGSNSQQWITYRDGSVYNNIVKQAELYPLNSLMLPGVIYAKLDLAKVHVNENLKDFKDQVRSFFGTGTQLQELYVSYDLMTDSCWEVLAEAARWARNNQNVLVDSHWIGGSPFNLEIYGFAAWNNNKGTITLRNPDDKRKSFKLLIDRVLEIPGQQPSIFVLKCPWMEDKDLPAITVKSGAPFEINLLPFEVLIFDVTPK